MENRKSIEIGSIKLSFVEKVTYQSLNEDSYQEKFQELKDGSYIIADSFDSNTWKLTNKTSEELQTVVFDVGLYPEINNALKCFVVMARHSGMSPQHTKRNQYLVKELAWITKGFTDIGSFELHLDEISEKIIFYDVESAFKKFADFYSFPEKEAFLEKVTLFNRVEYTVRDLPPFRDVFIFEDIMNHYSQMNSDEFLKLKYYPVELWWYITNIIAMRPNEFLRIRMDCLEPKNDGTFWITIPRSKLKSKGPEQEFWEQPLQIDEKIYRFIKEYIFQLDRLEIESEFLFPQELYKMTHPMAKNDYERISNNQFYDLLKFFFIEIVKEKYEQREITRIRPGDTRHFAIMNMFFQGFNMLSIARMAGHSKIDQPSHYYSHIPELSESFAYHLANTRPYEISINKILPGGLLGLRREAYDRGQKYKKLDTSNLRRVDYGFCEDVEGFPTNCGEDCRPCGFYAFLPSVNEEKEGLEWLEDFSNEMKRKMDEQIDYLNSLYGTISKEKNKYSENEVKWASKNLQQYMDQKLMVDLKILWGYYENGTSKVN